MSDTKNNKNGINNVDSEQNEENLEENLSEDQQMSIENLFKIIEKLQSQNQELNSKVSTLENELAGAKKQYYADLKNEMRGANEANKISLVGKIIDFIKDILQDVDLLQMALYSTKHSEQESSLVKGLEMTIDSIENSLQKRGAKKIQISLGDQYDPTHCKAVGFVENSEMPENSICEVKREGWMIDVDGNFINIRPSEVLVSKNTN